jgi:hypothetical protein
MRGKDNSEAVDQNVILKMNPGFLFVMKENILNI